MPELLPFHGLLPVPERAAEVAAVPYDVVNTREAAALAAGNPWSFLHVSRPEIDLEPGIDLHDDRVYEQAGTAFRRLCNEVPLQLDPGKHLYIYRLQMGDHVQTGVLGAASAAEYRAGIIKKHENTRKDKEDDRTRHVMTLRSHTGPAFLTYRDSTAIDAMVAAETTRTPLFDFTAPDGIRHTLWRISESQSEMLAAEFRRISCFYIADGHHRSAAAARTAAECAPANPHHTGQEDYNFFLAVAFPATQLAILPYNRAVRTLNGHTPEGFLKELATAFSVTPAQDGKTGCPGEIKMYLAGRWYLLKPNFDPSVLGVIERLDVSILQDNVLAPLLGITDPRTSSEIDFIGGIRGVAALEKMVDSGEFAVSFSMYPTTVEQLMAIADAGAIMPPKSTWFEPKLRDGLVCHNF